MAEKKKRNRRQHGFTLLNDSFEILEANAKEQNRSKSNLLEILIKNNLKPIQQHATEITAKI